MALFKNKYRIESARLSNWDYGQAGYYYVTICTQYREKILCNVVDDAVHLTDIGNIVAEEWIKTPAIRTNVRLGAWIIMPNHIHAVLVITHKVAAPSVETPYRGVSTTLALDPPSQTEAASAKWTANTLGSIIGQFKGKCTKRIRAKGFTEFAWQTRFYDHIVRNPAELMAIQRYIEDNPAHWKKDRDNKAGLYM